MSEAATSFSARVYDLALSIPPGRVTTYGILAKAAGGGAMASRSITSILGKAPNQSTIPYHRIVYADGTAWLPAGGEATRLDLYATEGIRVTETDSIVNFDEIVYHFD